MVQVRSKNRRWASSELAFAWSWISGSARVSSLMALVLCRSADQGEAHLSGVLAQLNTDLSAGATGETVGARRVRTRLAVSAAAKFWQDWLRAGKARSYVNAHGATPTRMRFIGETRRAKPMVVTPPPPTASFGRMTFIPCKQTSFDAGDEGASWLDRMT